MPQKTAGSVADHRKPVCATADMTVAAAARLMMRHRVGVLLILQAQRPAGIFTERDALFRVLAVGRDPAATKIGEVMTRDAQAIEEFLAGFHREAINGAAG
jgi:CBS domain-containing protein